MDVNIIALWVYIIQKSTQNWNNLFSTEESCNFYQIFGNAYPLLKTK